MNPMILATQIAAAQRTLEESQRSLEEAQRRLHDSTVQVIATAIPLAIAAVALLLQKALPERVTRSTRRLLVIGAAAGMGAITIVLLLPEGSPLVEASSAWIVVMFLFVTSGLRRWTYIFARDLDERQREQVMSAHRFASGLIGASPLIGFFVLFHSWFTARFDAAQGVTGLLSENISLTRACYLAALLTYFNIAAPGLILAWREPDAPQEERRGGPREA